MSVRSAETGGVSSAPASVSYSVVLAVFDAADTVQACLDSVARQTHGRVELIVIDGGSSDGTVEVLRASQDDIDYWVSEPDRGITHAWNKALPHATGDWIMFLGADDRLASPDVLAAAAESLAAAYPPHRVGYGAVRMVTRDGVATRDLGRPWAESCDAFRVGMSIPHQGTFHHRSLFEVHGVFDESYRLIADYDMLLRELLTAEPLFIPGLLVTEMGAGGLTDDPRNPTLVRELHRVWYEHGLTDTPPYRSPAAMRARVRDAVSRLAGPTRETQITSAYRRIVHRPRR